MGRRSVGILALGLAVATLLAAAAGCAAPAAKYPSGPVTVLVGWAAGSASDTGARALAEATVKHFGQPIAVQNVPGAGGGLAAMQVSQAKPDGYTLLFTAFGIVTQPHLEDVTYKPLEDFIPILQVGGYPEVLVVRAESPYKSLKELMDYAKANPGKVRWATSGFGSAPDLTGQLLARSGAAEMTAVPFNSGAEGVAAALGGHVDAAISTTGATIALLREGKLRALGISMAERDKGAPDIPTMKEQGFDVQLLGWWAIAAPKGTPESIVQSLHDAFKKGLADPPYTTVMEKALQPIVYLGPKDTLAKWKADYEAFGALLKAAKKK